MALGDAWASRCWAACGKCGKYGKFSASFLWRRANSENERCGNYASSRAQAVKTFRTFRTFRSACRRRGSWIRHYFSLIHYSGRHTWEPSAPGVFIRRAAAMRQARSMLRPLILFHFWVPNRQAQPVKIILTRSVSPDLRRQRSRWRCATIFVASRCKCSDHHCSGTAMPRPRYRACLQDGLKLDLNQLARNGFIKFGANVGIRGITWSNSYWGEIASGSITANMAHSDKGWFEISIGGFRQRITLVSRPRHFGGRQWFFQCPATNRLARHSFRSCSLSSTAARTTAPSINSPTTSCRRSNRVGVVPIESDCALHTAF
jgi:hypothetical protein